MAKSKEQKRREARERAREGFHHHIGSWLRIQGNFEREAHYFGIEDARSSIRKEANVMVRAMQTAQVDHHGNAVELHELEEKILDFKRFVNRKFEVNMFADETKSKPVTTETARYNQHDWNECMQYHVGS
jgi:hypothetical protein